VKRGNKYAILANTQISISNLTKNMSLILPYEESTTIIIYTKLWTGSAPQIQRTALFGYVYILIRGIVFNWTWYE